MSMTFTKAQYDDFWNWRSNDIYNAAPSVYDGQSSVSVFRGAFALTFMPGLNEQWVLSFNRETFETSLNGMPNAAGSTECNHLTDYLKRILSECEKEDQPYCQTRFPKFLKERYEGGKKKVPNPNSKTRSTYPEVAVSTALKDEAFHKRVWKEFQQWSKTTPSKPEKLPPMRCQEIKKGEPWCRIRFLDNETTSLFASTWSLIWETMYETLLEECVRREKAFLSHPLMSYKPRPPKVPVFEVGHTDEDGVQHLVQVGTRREGEEIVRTPAAPT